MSRATVSHVLNGQVDRFPEETRQKVLQAAEDLAYLPSPAGRSLANGRSDTIVVLFPNSTFSVILQNIVDQVSERTASLNANVVLQFAKDDLDATVESLLRLRPMAVIDFSGLIGSEHHLRFEAMHTIVVPREPGPASNREIFALVDQIAECQVEALVAHGSRPLYFAVLADQRSDIYGPIRGAGVARACEHRGLTPPEVISIPLDLETAVAALAPIVDAGTPVGVACYNDDVAIAVLAAARELGLHVPDDIGVVGADHTELGQLWVPRLTTVQVEMDLVVSFAIDQLLSDLGAPTDPSTTDYTRLAVSIPGATT